MEFPFFVKDGRLQARNFDAYFNRQSFDRDTLTAANEPNMERLTPRRRGTQLRFEDLAAFVRRPLSPPAAAATSVPSGSTAPVRPPVPPAAPSPTFSNANRPSSQPDMASLKRSDSKTPKPAPPRSCIICTEPASEVKLIQPCRSCETDYCTGCLLEMFQSATTDNTRMPPRCCNFLQIHTVLGKLTHDQAKAYREKFEEWIAQVKTYCPSPTCSTFIPERKLTTVMPTTTANTKIPSLQSVQTEILEQVTRSSPARFFREPMDITQLPGYTKVIVDPMDLSMIKHKLSASKYRTTADLTGDMKLIVKNAREYNGEKHPVTKAAEEFFDQYLHEVTKATDRLISSYNNSVLEKLFPCPKCHIAICVLCRQIEHNGAPCDTSAQDHELAMLETFGYKRCPRCKAGVKKMFGCSHMQCVCGAHWCYYCQKSLDQCDGSCEERAIDEESDFDEDDDGEGESDLSDEDEVVAPTLPLQAQAAGGDRGPPGPPGFAIAPPPPPRQDLPPPRAQAPQPITFAQTQIAAAEAQGALETAEWTQLMAMPQHQTTPAPPNQNVASRQTQVVPTPRNELVPVNLDAGGARRWMDGYDFGEEPEDEGMTQVWSCNHTFKPYELPPDDGINRGDLENMECNRCFVGVEPKRPEMKPSTKKRRKLMQGQGSKNDPIVFKEASPAATAEEKLAWECVRCKLVACVGCRDKYKAASKEDEE